MKKGQRKAGRNIDNPRLWAPSLPYLRVKTERLEFSQGAKNLVVKYSPAANLPQQLIFPGLEFSILLKFPLLEFPPSPNILFVEFSNLAKFVPPHISL